MNGTKLAVLDSNILIYKSKDLIDFQAITERYDQLFVSAISYMETLGYGFDSPNEKRVIHEILDSLVIIQTNMDIARQVVAYKQIRKIKTPDAIILATARHLGTELVTVNEQDFKSVDPKVGLFVPSFLPR